MKRCPPEGMMITEQKNLNLFICIKGMCTPMQNTKTEQSPGLHPKTIYPVK